jgi:predicted ArsR family transcriptional regulator
MLERDPERDEVDRFILGEIESVPHLEALLLLWKRQPDQWSIQQMAEALYISPEAAQPILLDLKQRGFAKLESGRYSYHATAQRDELIAKVDRIYRRELVRISTMIHTKPSAAVRAFARAFRFTKD